MPLAHAGNWLISTLYVVPMIVIGSVLWWTSRKERAEQPHKDRADDPRMGDDPAA